MAEPTDIEPPAQRVLGPVTQERDLKTILEKRNAKKRKIFPIKVELNASDSDFELCALMGLNGAKLNFMFENFTLTTIIKYFGCFRPLNSIKKSKNVS